MCISQASKYPELNISYDSREENLVKIDFSSPEHKPTFFGLAPSLELSGSCANLLKLKQSSENNCRSNDFCNASVLQIPSFVISNEEMNNESMPQRGQAYESDKMTIIDTDDEQKASEVPDLSNRRLSTEYPSKRGQSPEDQLSDQDKDLSDILSAMSNEECSVSSDVLDASKYNLPQNSDGEDPNSHICHIDSPETSDTTTCPNSETIHGESIMDDISSVLGQDLVMAMVGRNGEIENTFTDETTLFTSDTTSELQMDSRNPSLEKYDDRIFNFLHRSRKPTKEIEEKFGFENKVFNLSTTTDTVKYCSLAQFVEGNDIARKSFKRHMRQSKKRDKNDANMVRQNVLNEEIESGENTKDDNVKGSTNNLSSSIATDETVLERNNDFNNEYVAPVEKESLKVDIDIKQFENVSRRNSCSLGIQVSHILKDEINKISSETTIQKDRLTLDVEMDSPIGGRMFPRVSVVVEPPSPSSSEGHRGSGLLMGSTGGFLGGNGLGSGLLGGPLWARERRCSDNGPRTSLDVERCPSATRRISCGSLFQPGDASR